MLRSGGAGFMAWLDLAEGSIYGALCFPWYLQPIQPATNWGRPVVIDGLLVQLPTEDRISRDTTAAPESFRT